MEIGKDGRYNHKNLIQGYSGETYTATIDNTNDKVFIDSSLTDIEFSKLSMSSGYTVSNNGDVITKEYLDDAITSASSSITGGLVFGPGTGTKGSIKAINDTTVTSSANYSYAEGSKTTASGMASHAEGVSTTASGICSHAEGNLTTASGGYSHAEGNNTKSSGMFSHSEGNNTTAGGNFSHSEGNTTLASGESSHAGGKGYSSSDKKIIASGISAFNHSENTTTQTEGYGALANNSAILGGINHHIQSTALRSVILGGSGMTATQPDTVYMNKLNINSLPAKTTETDVLYIASDGTVSKGAGGSTTTLTSPDGENSVDVSNTEVKIASGGASTLRITDTICNGQFNYPESSIVFQTWGNGFQANNSNGGYAQMNSANKAIISGKEVTIQSANEDTSFINIHTQGSSGYPAAYNGLYINQSGLTLHAGYSIQSKIDIIVSGITFTSYVNPTMVIGGIEFSSEDPGSNATGSAFILKAPNGNRYKVTVDNSGVLTTTLL